ncbi:MULTISPECIES: hypothetical protein [Pseudoalteromonas]|uniref:hypothetical protein n=1 Tax=Pseudoalteromonas TaxID=53246 RepID=UPI001583CC31|nr:MULTISPECIES: hypothetical protein [Pseudoalteromonas]MDI4654578.1 hypothetical protein [Pseudoalteromonas shioyasakiensis]NUJ40153.1 hypothetical protein [Pseudoalteromonas sp. 0303]
MAATKKQIVDLERCNINLAALGNIREQLEKVRPSDDVFSEYIVKIHSMIDEMSADEISLRDAYVEELTN